jgi:hypothetical protein
MRCSLVNRNSAIVLFREGRRRIANHEDDVFRPARCYLSTVREEIHLEEFGIIIDERDVVPQAVFSFTEWTHYVGMKSVRGLDGTVRLLVEPQLD